MTVSFKTSIELLFGDGGGGVGVTHLWAPNPSSGLISTQFAVSDKVVDIADTVRVDDVTLAQQEPQRSSGASVITKFNSTLILKEKS